eukprot:c9663_g1_i2.p1 GENE.c9663_g1_i2~~c9663_g1_i2.p1  ORF type:complete len:267 (-),score=27.62 c9663_g1_i2:52-852(-)
MSEEERREKFIRVIRQVIGPHASDRAIDDAISSVWNRVRGLTVTVEPLSAHTQAAVNIYLRQQCISSSRWDFLLTPVRHSTQRTQHPVTSSPNPNPNPNPNNTGFESLPEDILLAICDFAVLPESSNAWCSAQTLVAISQVNKRVRQIVKRHDDEWWSSIHSHAFPRCCISCSTKDNPREMFLWHCEMESKMICPACKRGSVMPVLYGYPSPELVALVQANRIKLGGDYFVPGDVLWQCQRCRAGWVLYPYTTARPSSTPLAGLIT